MIEFNIGHVINVHFVVYGRVDGCKHHSNVIGQKRQVANPQSGTWRLEFVQC